MREYKKKPRNLGVKLGEVKYGSSKWQIYNKNGQAVAVVLSKVGIRRWIVTKNHVGMGYMLRKLGLEANAGGGLFRHYSLPKNAFNRKGRKAIIKLQQNAGR